MQPKYLASLYPNPMKVMTASGVIQITNTITMETNMTETRFLEDILRCVLFVFLKACMMWTFSIQSIMSGMTERRKAWIHVVDMENDLSLQISVTSTSSVVRFVYGSRMCIVLYLQLKKKHILCKPYFQCNWLVHYCIHHHYPYHAKCDTVLYKNRNLIWFKR